MPELPEELETFADEVVCHARVPVKLRTHSEKVRTSLTEVFEFYEDFTLPITENWTLPSGDWHNVSVKFISPPFSACHDDIGTDAIIHINFSSPQVAIYFYHFPPVAVSSLLGVGHSSYGQVIMGQFADTGVWNHFKALFYYDWSKHKCRCDIFKDIGSVWTLMQTSFFGITFPLSERIYFYSNAVGILNEEWLDDITCYGLW